VSELVIEREFQLEHLLRARALVRMSARELEIWLACQWGQWARESEMKQAPAEGLALADQLGAALVH
jgi:hypothetical protein